MTTTTPYDDRQLLDAGARLAAAPVAVPELARLVRRRRRRRGAGASLAVAGLVAGGVALLGRDPDPSRVETTETTTTTAAVDPVPDPPAVPTYDLDLDGADLTEDQPLAPSGAEVTLWADRARQTWLSLTVRPGLGESNAEPAGLGPMRPDTGFPAEQGRAWTTDLPDDGPTRSLGMWWTRANDDVWLLRAHWYGDDPVPAADARAALRAWALGISPGPIPQDGPAHILDDRAMPVVDSDPGGSIAAHVRVWRYQGEEITLLAERDAAATELSNLVARGRPVATAVAGRGAWRVAATSPTETLVGWRLGPSQEVWYTLHIPDALSGRVDEILAAVVPVDGG
jgi:hypothetical protein